MPYLTKENRQKFDSMLREREKCSTPGELNYIITVILTDYMQEKGLSYSTINDMVGALECCKLELYRRIAAPYEDTKIVQNGDVYPKT
jgi:hypothetical protein